MFRASNINQDKRYQNKQEQLKGKLKFPAILSKPVFPSKINMEVIKPWIVKTTFEHLKVEDEIVPEYIFELLSAGDTIDGKDVCVKLLGFFEGSTGEFMKSLWKCLVDAQESEGGIPQFLVEQVKKDLELRAKQEKERRERQQQQQQQEEEAERQRQRRPPQRETDHSGERRRDYDTDRRRDYAPDRRRDYDYDRRGNYDDRDRRYFDRRDYYDDDRGRRDYRRRDDYYDNYRDESPFDRRRYQRRRSRSPSPRRHDRSYRSISPSPPPPPPPPAAAAAVDTPANDIDGDKTPVYPPRVYN